MFVVANFLAGLANVLNLILQLYMYILIARVVLSWVNPNPRHPIARSIVHFIYRATDPLLYWVRRRLPLAFGGIDFSPMAVILAIIFVRIFVVQSLLQAAARLSY